MSRLHTRNLSLVGLALELAGRAAFFRLVTCRGGLGTLFETFLGDRVSLESIKTERRRNYHSVVAWFSLGIVIRWSEPDLIPLPRASGPFRVFRGLSFS